MRGWTGYAAALLRSVDWPRPGRRVLVVSLAMAVVMAAAAAVNGGGVTGGGASGAEADSAVTPGEEVSVGLTERATRLVELFQEVESVYADEVAPLERVLLGYRQDDPHLVRRIAVALHREARRTELEPRLLLAVLLVENPWLNPEARSFMGARGLMQVMPFHEGRWDPCPPRLDDVDANICHGASIFAAYLKQERGNVHRALLRYNGCVRGTNTPNCHQYPDHVYARAGRASIEAWRNAGTPGAAP
jgi:soluble lytic murein transglycosylase-like protein